MNAALGVATRLRSRRGVSLLHSARDDDGCGQWSFVACDPVRSIEAHGDTISLYDRSGMVRERFNGNPLDILQELVRDHTRRWTDEIAGPVPVAIGYLGYDLGRLLTKLKKGAARRVDALPDMWFGIYDAVWRFDEKSRKSDIVGKSAGARRTLAEAIARGDDTRHRPPVFDALLPQGSHGNMSIDEERTEYAQRLERVHKHLRAGDVSRVRLARRFAADVREAGDPLALYASLMRVAPAPFAAYMSIPLGEQGDVSHLLSSSAERFLCRAPSGDRLENRPSEAVRRRTGDAERDRQLAAEIADNERARAQHQILVDGQRDVLARISEPGSTTVEKFAYVVESATHLRLVSRITGGVRPNLGVLEILRATFPGSALSGAPRERALEIIDQIEPIRRGVYTGAIGYLGLGNAMDLSVATRTAVLDRDRLVLCASDTIVADPSVTTGKVTTGKVTAGKAAGKVTTGKAPGDASSTASTAASDAASTEASLDETDAQVAGWRALMKL